MLVDNVSDTQSPQHHQLRSHSPTGCNVLQNISWQVKPGTTAYCARIQYNTWWVNDHQHTGYRLVTGHNKSCCPL